MYYEKLTTLSLASVLMFAASSASFADGLSADSVLSSCEVSPGTFERDCFCADEENQTKYEDTYDEVCLALPNDAQVTNFSPLIAPLLGLVVLGAVAGGSGGGGSTVNTTSN